MHHPWMISGHMLLENSKSMEYSSAYLKVKFSIGALMNLTYMSTGIISNLILTEYKPSKITGSQIHLAVSQHRGCIIPGWYLDICSLKTRSLWNTAPQNWQSNFRLAPSWISRTCRRAFWELENSFPQIRHLPPWTQSRLGTMLL